jgi:hypothetical protein
MLLGRLPGEANVVVLIPAFDVALSDCTAPTMSVAKAETFFPFGRVSRISFEIMVCWRMF